MDEQFVPAENSAGHAPIAAASLASDFGIDGLAASLAFYTPAGTWTAYPEDGPQRYAEVRGEHLAYSLQLSAAWRFVRGASVGCGLRFFSLHINNVSAVSTYPGPFGAPEDRDLDSMVQTKAADNMIPGVVVGGWWNLGNLWAPLKHIELGFSFVSGFAVNAAGHLNVRLPSHPYYDGVTVEPERPPVTVVLHFPWMVRTGIRWNHEVFDIELDVAWEGWSTNDRKVFDLTAPSYYRNLPAIGDYALTDTERPLHYEDTVAINVGGSVRPAEWLALRAGFLWESGAVPDAYYSVSDPDSEKFGIGLGIGIEYDYLRADMGYMHIFQQARDIRPGQSLVTQTNPSNPEQVTYVGAGKYDSGYDMLGLAVRLKVDELF
ncbi:MAG: hypothetical protein D6806_16545 [Deltaproteobacteria bacterium]|nr:MAG: hypothetical protein D6806_16545 [Deltaproteobacteria bacterium]